MEITREQTQNKIMGESVATAEFIGSGTKINVPMLMLNSQELWSKLTIEEEYRFTITDRYDVFNADPFFDTTREGFVSTAQSSIDKQIGYIDNLYDKAYVKAALYVPRFSNNLSISRREEIDFTREVSMQSDNYPVTVLEATTFEATKRLIEEVKAEMKKEKIEKDVFLIADMGQNEALFSQKVAFAGSAVSGIIAEWENPQLRWGNFLTLADASAYENFLRMMVNVPPRYKDAAVAPATPLFVDMASHARVFGGSSDSEKKVTKEAIIKKSIINVRTHFGSENGMYTRSQYKAKSITEHGCDCSIHEFTGKAVQDFYSEMNDNLYAASKSHNARSIAKEIEATKLHIKSGSLRKFYRMKLNTIDVLEHLFSVDTSGKQAKIEVGRQN
jgi:hypothetical protein